MRHCVVGNDGDWIKRRICYGDFGDGRTTDTYIHPYFVLRSKDILTHRNRTVQQACIPQAIIGTDVICQAKSGLGKTAVFVLATLQRLEPVDGETHVLVMCHTRELAFQIKNEYARFSKYLPKVRTAVFYGGTPIQKDYEVLANKDTHPHIIVGTPGRMNALVRDKKLRLGALRQFVLDECDKMLDQVGMSDEIAPY
jgi:ATP-dependent RNA helicase UAP56/SUB2